MVEAPLRRVMFNMALGMFNMVLRRAMFMFNLAIIAHENNMDQFPFEKKNKSSRSYDFKKRSYVLGGTRPLIPSLSLSVLGKPRPLKEAFDLHLLHR